MSVVGPCHFGGECSKLGEFKLLLFELNGRSLRVDWISKINKNSCNLSGITELIFVCYFCIQKRVQSALIVLVHVPLPD